MKFARSALLEINELIMDKKSSPSRFVIAQFCDDIRQEIGNKYSLMGCYGHEMIIEKLPVSLPKLGILVNVFTGVAHPFSRLVIRAMMNDEIVAELEVPVENVSEAFQQIASTSELGRVAFKAMLVLSPLVVVEPCKVSVVAETEDGIIEGSYIKIRERTSADAPLKQS